MRAHFCFSRFCRRYSESLVRPRPCSPGGYGRISIGHFGDSHLLPLRNSFIFSRRQRLQSAPVYLAIAQTLRRFGGRQPLCGVGVTSEIVPTSRPTACSERIAVFRPEPGPLTKTSTLRMPCSCARRAAASAVICAANGVDLREPLKPTCPALAHEITLPMGSVIETIVLLNVLLMCACPCATFFFSLRRVFFGPVRFWAGATTSYQPSSCRRQPCADLYACGRWCGCAARAPAAHGGAGCPGRTRSRPCAECRPALPGAGHLRPCSWPRSSHAAGRWCRRRAGEPGDRGSHRS